MNFTHQQLNYGVVCRLAPATIGCDRRRHRRLVRRKSLVLVCLLDLERKIFFSECAHWPISSDSPGS